MIKCRMYDKGTKMMVKVHSSSTIYPIQSRGWLEPIMAVLGREVGHNLDWLTHRDRQPFKLMFTLTPSGNLESPANLKSALLGCGKKPEYAQRSHTCTERKCKLHTESPPCLPRIRTGDFAVRQQH